MESLLSGLSHHGYALLFAAVLLEAIGIPVPAALALLLAGAASASGSLSLPLVIASAISAMMLGDMTLFMVGRHTGWWLLGLLCRISLNPESCIFSAAATFHRRGRVMLVFAKFVPGINTMAPPLAGSMNMPVVQFLGLDLAGVVLYTAAYLSVGFLASGAIEKITRGYHTAARLMSWIFIALLIGYVGYQIWTWRKSRGLRLVPSVTPHEAAEALSADLAVIYDVRSHGYYDRDAMRVKGSRRLDPNALRPGQQDFPVDRRIYLYCTCVRQATSARVAQVLLRNGLPGAVIQGGLEAWKKAGLPLEPIPLDEIAVMPLFNS